MAQVLIHNSPEYHQAVALRRVVLRLPLGLDFTEADLDAESADIHFGILQDGACIACGILSPYQPGIGKIRQMAVAPELQGRGLGAVVVDAIEAYARTHGLRQITLNAREHAIGFYERLGYKQEGEPFLEVTLPHVRMRKQL